MRKMFRMKCPVCNHQFQYEGEEYEIENCPICGHQAPFRDFVQEEKTRIELEVLRGN